MVTTSRDRERAYAAFVVAGSRPQRVPYDEFLIAETASDERREWVDGVVYAMSRGSPEHGRLTGRVIARVESAAR
jgi:hypothetical protein